MVERNIAEVFDVDFKGELWVKFYTKIGDSCGEGNVMARNGYTGYGG